jgi:hypothetical protein
MSSLYQRRIEPRIAEALQDGAGRLVGVEVKAAATVKETDLRGLKKRP